jgi:hypothetical protein
MHSRVVSFAALAALVAVGTSARRLEACSLCHCGDPTYSLIGAQVFDSGFHLSLDGERFAKDQVALPEEGADPGTELAREEEVENRVTLSASHSLGNRVTLLARVPFSHRTITTEGSSQSGSGIADPELLGQARIWSSGPRNWLSVTGTLKTDWGKNDLTVDGERAEEHLQPGTGAWGGSTGFAFSKGLGAQSALFGSAFGRFNGRNTAGYHYGDVALANVAWERRLMTRLEGVVELNFRAARKDEEAPGEADPNTGGKVLYVTPRLLLRLTGDVWLKAGVQVPVWKDLYGDQDEKVNVLVGLSVRL